MPAIPNTYLVTGPLVDVAGSLIPPTAQLAAVNAITVHEGRIRRAALDSGNNPVWLDVSGWIAQDSAPTEPERYPLWYDTANAAAMVYDGSAYVALGTSIGGTPLTTMVVQRRYGTPVEQDPLDLNEMVSGAHGLGVVPSGAISYIECLTAEQGYDVGDKTDTLWGARGTFWWNDTMVGWVAERRGPFIVERDDTGENNEFQVTPANWKAVIIAYVDEQVSVTGLEGPKGNSVDVIYRRSNTVPATPGTGLGTAVDGRLTAAPAGWSLSRPGGTQDLYILMVEIQGDTILSYGNPILLGPGAVTAAQLPTDTLVGDPTITGQVITFTQADGSTVDITLPAVMPGTGDGVVAAGAFSADGTTLTLTIDNGNTVDITVPDLLRMSGGIVRPDSNGNLRDATAADVSNLAVDHQNIRIGGRISTTVDVPTVTYGTYAPANFLGVTSQINSIAFTQNGQTAYSTTNNAWYRYDNGVVVFWRGPTNWRGHYANMDAARDHIVGVGDIVYFAGEAIMRDVTAYSDTSVAFEYRWLTPQEIIAIQADIRRLEERPLLPTHPGNVLERGEVLLADTAANTYRLDERFIVNTPNPVASDVGSIVGVAENANGFALISLPPPSIPHLADIPDVTDTSPDIFYLDHDVFEGDREDAVFAPGFETFFQGYNAGSVGQEVGSISKGSPILRIIVNGTAASYTIDSVYSANAEFLSQFDMMAIANAFYGLGTLLQEGGLYFRRVLSSPTITTATVDINFQRSADSSLLFVDANGVIAHNQGLYEKIEDAYFAIEPNRVIHSTGTGPPTDNELRRDGELYINTLGQLWVAGGTIRNRFNPPTGTDVTFSDPHEAPNPGTIQEIFDQGGDGGFIVNTGGNVNSFRQWQGDDSDPAHYMSNVTWNAIWTYIASIEDTAAYRNLRDNSRWLGHFSTTTAAALAADLNLGDDDFAMNQLYYYSTSVGRIRVFTALTRGAVVEDNSLFWNGPFALDADVATHINDLIQANNGDPFTAELYTLTAGGINYDVLGQSERQEIRSLDEVNERTQDLQVIRNRNWQIATDAFIRWSTNRPSPQGVQQGTWTAQIVGTTGQTSGSWISARIPASKDIRYFNVNQSETATPDERTRHTRFGHG